uniref:Uncharacterized protein n=1 Tax=Tanacetum cinerariifolium TaxID=118510 RepID=A0A6L2MET7_TANCI|nr:hypothetical protein [Tanacetum cinerariifolium]
MQKIIKEQVKEQVKVQVSKILLKIEQIVNDQLEAEVLTQSSNSLKTSYAIAADLSEMELKKILIEKMEGNKSIHRSNEDVVMMMRIMMKNPPLDQTGGPRDEEKERSQSQQALQRRKLPGALHPEWFSQQKKPPTPDRDWNKTFLTTHGSIQPWINEVAKQIHSRASFNELMDTPVDFFAFLMNRIKVDTLTSELLAGPTYELMKGHAKQYPYNLLKPLPLIPNSQSRRVIPFDHFINNDLEYLRRGASSRKYTTSVTKTKAADYGHIKWIEDLLYSFAVNQEFARDVYSKCRIIAVIELKIVEWHNYKHLDWIMKKLNLTRPDTYRSDLKRKEAYIAYSNPRGFIYQNKDKQNRLMRIDELHKFSVGTLTDVRTTLDDRLKDKGCKERSPPYTLGRNQVNMYAIRNTKLFSGIEDSHHVPSDAMHNPSQPLKVGKTLFQNSRRYTHFYQLSHSELVGIEKEFERPTTHVEPCRVIIVRTPDHEDHHDDDACLEGEISTKEQLEDFDAWNDDQGTNDDEVPDEEVSPKLLAEVSGKGTTVDDLKRMQKALNDMMRSRCDSGKEHQCHLDKMKSYMESQTVWESRKEDLSLQIPKEPALIFLICARDPSVPPMTLLNQDLFYLKNENS